MAHFIGVNAETGEKSASGMASLVDVGKDSQAKDGSKDALTATDGGRRDASKDDGRSFGIVTKG